MFGAALAADVSTVFVTSYNEWGEGTQIEPAVPHTVRCCGVVAVSFGLALVFLELATALAPGGARCADVVRAVGDLLQYLLSVCVQADEATAMPAEQRSKLGVGVRSRVGCHVSVCQRVKAARGHSVHVVYVFLCCMGTAGVGELRAQCTHVLHGSHAVLAGSTGRGT